MVAVKKTPQVQAIYNFFNFFEKWIAQPKAEIGNEVDKYLNKSFTFFSNGQQMAKSCEDYKQRMNIFKEKYSEFKISEPIEEPVISGNQAIIHYKIDLKTHKGDKRQVQIMAMGTIENNKISRWIQVVGEGGPHSWDKK
jgi:hypothetical protein